MMDVVSGAFLPARPVHRRYRHHFIATCPCRIPIVGPDPTVLLLEAAMTIILKRPDLHMAYVYRVERDSAAASDGCRSA
jgi:hypothetical protein